MQASATSQRRDSVAHSGRSTRQELGLSRRRIVSRHHRGLSSVTLTALLASLSVAPAKAAIPIGNLLVNGNAELGIGSSDSSTTAPIPISGWTTTTNFTEHTYDPVGSNNFRTSTQALRSTAGSSSRQGDRKTAMATTSRPLLRMSPSPPRRPRSTRAVYRRRCSPTSAATKIRRIKVRSQRSFSVPRCACSVP